MFYRIYVNLYTHHKRAKYPLNIMEWPPPEKRLMELIEKTGRNFRIKKLGQEEK